jgi:ABC-type branched-subunit amino acid transport system ATPase component
VTGTEILQIDEVHAGYQPGVDVLQGLSLAVAERSLTLVIGPNGAGKSTLLRAVFGFLKPHRGSVRFRGKPIAALPPHRIKLLGIGYVPQDINIFPHLTVEENLKMGGWTLRRNKARLESQLTRIYDIFPVLAERRRARAGELSGGQGRMLSVAREMMTEPLLLLVDEPTAGLAPALVGQVYELLQTARRETDASILLVDQNIEDAVQHADHVYMVDLGRIKASGPATEFDDARIRALIQECLLG